MPCGRNLVHDRDTDRDNAQDCSASHLTTAWAANDAQTDSLVRSFFGELTMRFRVATNCARLLILSFLLAGCTKEVPQPSLPVDPTADSNKNETSDTESISAETNEQPAADEPSPADETPAEEFTAMQLLYLAAGDQAKLAELNGKPVIVTGQVCEVECYPGLCSVCLAKVDGDFMTSELRFTTAISKPDKTVYWGQTLKVQGRLIVEQELPFVGSQSDPAALVDVGPVPEPQPPADFTLGSFDLGALERQHESQFEKVDELDGIDSFGEEWEIAKAAIQDGRLRPEVLDELALWMVPTYIQFKTDISPEGLKGVAGLEMLRGINFGGFEGQKITDEHLVALQDAKYLRTLVIKNPGGITSAGLSHLANWKYLTSLTLGKYDAPARLDASSAQHLAQLKFLRSADFNHAELSDEALSSLVKLPNLQSLKLESSQITGAGFKDVPADAPLRFLEVYSCPQLQADALAHLRDLPLLLRLNAHTTMLGDTSFADLQGLPALADVNLDNTQVGDAALEQLSKLPSLRELGLQGTKITTGGLQSLSSAKSLRKLSADDSVLTPEAKEQLKETLPDLQFD